jgi:glycosyltransferase involved in cell wall biosynthesis
VTTSVVNDGLGAEPGREIVIADDVRTAANQIVSLLHDDGLRTRIGQAGRQFVRERYTWGHVVERMRQIEGVLAAKHRGQPAA